MSTTAQPTDLYDIPADLREFRDLVRRIATEQVAPRAAEIDTSDEYPWDLRALLGEQDILGLPFAQEHGGMGTGTLMQQMAVEELAKASAAVALILMIQELGTLPISLFGSDDAQDPLPAQVRQRRMVAGVLPVRARSGLRRLSDAHERTAGRRRMDHQRHQELDHQRRDR